jgi:hypothetical protein
MSKSTLILLLASTLFATTVHAQNSEQMIAVTALGAKKWNDKNDNGVKCLNFSKGNHRQRLEDVNVHKEVKDGKTRFWGTFTVTNRRRFKPDPHIFVDFAVVGGKVDHLKLRADGGGNWHDALPDDWASKGAKKILDSVMSLGTSGDAQTAMASSVWTVTEAYRLASD